MLSGFLSVMFIVYALIGCLWGGITSKLAKDKKLTSGVWFWCGFLSAFLSGVFGGFLTGFIGGLPAVIVIIMFPEYNVEEAKQEVENKLIAIDNEKRLQETGWRCSCGNLNASYTGTCSCGRGKGEI